MRYVHVIAASLFIAPTCACYSYVAIQPRSLLALDNPERVGTTTYPVIGDQAVPTLTEENRYSLTRENGRVFQFAGDPDAVEITTADHSRHHLRMPLRFSEPTLGQLTVTGPDGLPVTYDWSDFRRARVDAPDDTATIALIASGSVLVVAACVALPFLL